MSLRPGAPEYAQIVQYMEAGKEHEDEDGLGEAVQSLAQGPGELALSQLDDLEQLGCLEVGVDRAWKPEDQLEHCYSDPGWRWGS